MPKFSAEELAEHVFSRTGAPNDDVLVGPGPGEDAAAIDVGGETLVVSTDPISLAADRIGRLAVAVASNDVATAGAVPEWLVTTIMLPRHDVEVLEEVSEQIDDAARDLEIAIVGGHTESVPGLSRPLLSLTCMGLADRFVSTGGATPGGRLLLTKGAGIEATAVLATDFADSVDVPGDVLERAAGFYDDLSVVPEARVLSPVATAMHDPTEGGVLTGLVEMALAAGVTFDVDRSRIPVRSETRELCRAAGVDPLRVLGSGGLLAAVPASGIDDALAELDAAGIHAVEIGRVARGEPGVVLDGDRHDTAPPDEMYDLWE